MRAGTFVMSNAKGELPARSITNGLPAAAKALKIVKQLRGNDERRSEAEFKLKIAELYSSIADVKTSLADAKEELATINKLNRTRSRDCGEQIVYELKASEVSDESPQHRICRACYHQGKITHLQFHPSDSGGEKDWYECSVCNYRCTPLG